MRTGNLARLCHIIRHRMPNRGMTGNSWRSQFVKNILSAFTIRLHLKLPPLLKLRRTSSAATVRILRIKNKAPSDTIVPAGALSNWWRWRESNPRPKIIYRRRLHAYTSFCFNLPKLHWPGYSVGDPASISPRGHRPSPRLSH